MQNLEQTILAQYANSPILNQWLSSLNISIDPVNLINSFYNNVWNVSTATGYGLDVWGRIVGVNRVLSIPGTSPKSFGFAEATTASADPFNQSPFYTGASATTNYILSDDAFRLLILVKALSNISRSDSRTYNHILMTLFPNRGNAYIQPAGVMSSTLVFEFFLAPFELSILRQSGALSPPTGVNFNIMIVDIPNVFGFAESGRSASTFNHGSFFSGYA